MIKSWHRKEINFIPNLNTFSRLTNDLLNIVLQICYLFLCFAAENIKKKEVADKVLMLIIWERKSLVYHRNKFCDRKIKRKTQHLFCCNCIFHNRSTFKFCQNRYRYLYILLLSRKFEFNAHQSDCLTLGFVSS